jgi:hypothetical protein
MLFARRCGDISISVKFPHAGISLLCGNSAEIPRFGARVPVPVPEWLKPAEFRRAGAGFRHNSGATSLTR